MKIALSFSTLALAALIVGAHLSSPVNGHAPVALDSAKMTHHLSCGSPETDRVIPTKI